MATKEFWDKIFKDFDAMSDKEFLAFVEECEKTPDVPFSAGICNFSPVTSEPEFFISVASVYVDSSCDINYNDDDWAWAA